MMDGPGMLRKRLEEFFSVQLEKIADAGLRGRVLDVWCAAAQEGGWSPDDLKAIPFTLLTETHGIDLIQHTIAVTEGALGLASAILEACSPPYEIEMDWLIAGGLLHDVGKLLEIEPAPGGGFRKSRAGKCARHPISGAILCARSGLPEEIVNMVACHAKEGEGRPQRIETVLIHQADFATFNPLVMLEKGLLID